MTRTRPRRTGPFVFAALTVVSLLLVRVATAQQGGPSLDELLDLEPKPADPRQGEGDKLPDAPKPGAPGDSGVPLDPSVERDLSREEAADAFRRAVQEMDVSADRLGEKQDPGIETQRLQESIIRKLDMVIAAAREQEQSSSSQQQQQQQQQQDQGSAQNRQRPGRPQQSQQPGSQSNRGTSAPPAQAPGPDSGAIDEQRREWGNLPPRLRDELLQGLSEKFSPVYKSITEAYYQRLAEERE